MSAFKFAVFAAILAVVACDRPSYGKSYYRPAYKPAVSYAPAPYAASYEPTYAPSSYKPTYKPAAYGNEYPDTHPQYQFDWAVKDDYSGNNYGHTEQRDGSKTSGQYRTLLPDGRYQIVTYTADEYGYNAQVHYEGEAKYDSYKPAASYSPKPVYAPAPYSKPAYGYRPSIY